MSEKKTLKIAVATHRTYDMPKQHDCYLPIHVGACNKASIGYQRDDEGDNISHLNPYYCELTALYWVWKNVEADYIGLAHYRRHFASQPTKYHENLDVNTVVLTEEKALELLKEADVLVPKKRNYRIETIYNHYAHTFDGLHLDVTRDIIKRYSPEYVETFDKVMVSTELYICNMFVMSKTHVDAYCKWVFPILDELFEKIDYSKMTPFEARFVGRVSERLFTVWVLQQQLKIKEVPVLYFGKVDWVNKISSFLKAKFTGKKYTKSF